MDNGMDKISIDIAEYRRLVDICCAADAFLRTESHEDLEGLRDAVLVRTGIID